MKFRGDIALVIFGILLLAKPQMFAYFMMTFIQVFETAWNSVGSGSNGDYQPRPTFQEEMKQFRSQVVDPRAQYHDQWGL